MVQQTESFTLIPFINNIISRQEFLLTLFFYGKMLINTQAIFVIKKIFVILIIKIIDLQNHKKSIIL